MKNILLFNENPRYLHIVLEGAGANTASAFVLSEKKTGAKTALIFSVTDPQPSLYICRMLYISTYIIFLQYCYNPMQNSIFHDFHSIEPR